MPTRLSDNDIKRLKADDAKELAIEYRNELAVKDAAPITEAQLQVEALAYELNLQKAKAADAEAEREFEKEIEELKTKQAELETKKLALESKKTEELKEAAALEEQVDSAIDNLTVVLQQAQAEHNLQLEKLDAEKDKYVEEIETQKEACNKELEEIRERLKDVSDDEITLNDLSNQIENYQKAVDAYDNQLLEKTEKTKEAKYSLDVELNEAKRTYSTQLAKLKADYEKAVVENKLDTAKTIAEVHNYKVISNEDLNALQRDKAEVDAEMAKARNAIAKSTKEAVHTGWNLPARETPLNVTEMYYERQSYEDIKQGMVAEIMTLKDDIKKMRAHIDGEPVRLASAIAAAKVDINNTIEQGTAKR